MHIDPVAQAYAHLDALSLKEVAEFKPRPPRFNPSSIGNCSRQQYYKGINVTPEPSPGFLRLYSRPGDFYHDETRCVMYEAGVEFDGLEFDLENRKVKELNACNIEITHNGATFPVRGRGDGKIKVNGEWLYNELKSVDGWKYRAMRNAYLKGDLEKYLRANYQSYFDQCNSMCAPEMLDMPGTYLIIVNRGSCQFGFTDRKYQNPEGGMVFRFDPDRWEQQKTKMAMVTKRIAAGDPPLRGHAEGSKKCQQCAYEGKCWNE